MSELTSKWLLEAKDAKIARLSAENENCKIAVSLSARWIAERDAKIDRLTAENELLRAALIPFAHPDLMLRLGGNSPSEGGAAIVFQRNNAYLRLRDFDSAFEALKETTE